MAVQARSRRPARPSTTSGVPAATETTVRATARGAEYMLPRPRDFTKGIYQIRTTASGELPTDADLMRVVIRRHAGDRDARVEVDAERGRARDVVDLHQVASRTSSRVRRRTPIAVGKAPSVLGGGHRRRARGVREAGVLQVPRRAGTRRRTRRRPRSRTTSTIPSAPPISRRTGSSTAGRTVEEIYTRLRTGLDGTPMPSFSDALDAKVVTDEQLWHVAQ